MKENLKRRQKSCKIVVHRKIISKEKNKLKQHFLGYSFSAVTECKKYCDESSPLLVYFVNENGEQVFKISALKMKIAKKKKWIAKVIMSYKTNIVVLMVRRTVAVIQKL